MGAPTRYSGVTNAAKNGAMSQLGMLDPTKFHTWMNDFDSYAAGDWVITTTEAGSSSATEAQIAGADGGVLLVTNDNADNDLDFFQWAGGSGATVEAWKFELGKKLFFKSRLKVSDATQCDFVMGLQITDTTSLAVSDGVYFRKDDDDAFLDAVVIKNSTATTGTAIHTVVSDTFLDLGFYYNGKDEVQFFVNDVKKATLATTNLVDDEELCVSFGLQNGAAAAKTMSIDYIFVAKER
jgi:hypothetical protein